MNDNYLTVTALTKYMKRKIETDQHLQSVLLRGEISNFKHHSRGHMYLTIKDEHTRVQAVMFAGQNRRLLFAPENGMNVLIQGEIGVFEPFGQYQLYIQKMEPDGIGALYIRFEQLKEKLQKQGFFDVDKKQPLPIYPKHIGIITSPTGAAVRDILTTIKRRFPIVKTTVLPVLVQGERSAESIRQAITYANNESQYDLLIIGRGGGSIEELWSFNEESVANAIFASRIPVISAVGHETDTTISDFVADLRAPTPTGAAEQAVPSQIEIVERIQGLRRNLTTNMKQMIADRKNKLTHLEQSYAFRYPAQLLAEKEQELDRLVERLTRASQQLLTDKRQLQDTLHKRLVTQHPMEQLRRVDKQLQQLTKRLPHVMEQITKQKSDAFSNLVNKLTLLNPLEIMKRGYAIPYATDGKIIRSISAVEKKDPISVRLTDGVLACEIIDVKGDESHGNT